MRLFVAVDLDDRVRRGVERLIGRMRAETRDGRAFRIFWVAPERLHLTLHFLGNVTDEIAARLVESVAAPIDLPAFHVVFGGMRTFSSRRRPNVIWLDIVEGKAPLIELHAVVGKRLKAVGCALEERPFSPHLTLARLRQTRGTGPRHGGKGGLSPVPLPVQGTGPVQFEEGGLSPVLVDHVTLYESQLGRDGATHTAMATGGLRPAPTSQ
jgi:RNA 2',3'-cyclic 3'-phosphodiesterase